MKGTILDYTGSEAFILLDDDSIITVPAATFSHSMPIGSIISLSDVYNKTSNIKYSPANPYDKTVDFF